MKRKGFTLAEVLIALSIVGIIAALTIPNMVTSYKKSVFGSSLAVAVSNFETAMQGMIIKLSVEVGDKVTKGDSICVIEAMKMENNIEAEYDGVVTDILVEPGDAVAIDGGLMVIKPE